MSYSTDRTDPELDFFGSLIASTSGETTQSTMPVTPMMGTDVYLTANPAAVNSHFYNPCIDGTSVTAASISAVNAASGQFLMSGAKDNNVDSPFICYQQYPSSGGTLPRAIPYPASQPFSPAMTAQTYAYSPAELGAHLHEISMAASSTPTPQIHVASPELLGIGGVGQLGAGMVGNDFLRQIVHQTHAPTPRLHSHHHSHSSVGDSMGMGGFLPASTASLYTMPITGPAQVPAEPLFAPVCYADMSNSGSRRSSGAAAHAAYAPNSVMAAHSSGHIGQHDTPGLAQNNGLLGDGNVFGSAGSFIIGTPVTNAGALSQSFTSVFSDISLGSSHGESQAMSPAFTNQAISGVVRNSSRLARMRPGRSLSISEPFHTRLPSPALSALGVAPHTSAHPYFPSAAYQSFGGALSPSMGVAALNQHSDDQSNVYSSAETGKAYSEGAWQHPKSNSSSRLALLRSKSGPQSRPRPRVARSMLSSPSTVAVGSVSASIESHSSDEAYSDDERTDAGVKTEQDTRASTGRTPLTPMQREVFFRWLYQNIHDPKPKGSERDRLRAIGNMSRERFKTWFANARRRYFTITFENGVQRYTMNSRFIVACQRADIKLDE
ncbi:hypothetical protein GGI17_004925 [Coemansia sp. S146]|nr:hypothetical protein GGI17_004925 [Coemansia sp. S146]